MTLQQAVDLAVKELPENWMIRIEIMKDYENVILESPDLNQIDIADGESCLAKLVLLALKGAQESSVNFGESN